MEKETIKNILIEKQREIQNISLIQRPISFEDNMNYVLVGIRRAGKSYLLYQDILGRIASEKMTAEDFLLINFEDERIASIESRELNIIIEAYSELYDKPKPYIYLDEIQNIEGWEKFARRLVEMHYRVMITGSNAKMLGREIATTLGGAFIVREVMPFSFAEYLKWNDISLTPNWEYDSRAKSQVVRLFGTYFHFGGFAEAFPLLDKREWINSLYQRILLGDIAARNGIRNPNVLRILSRKIAEVLTQPCSLARFVNILKSSGQTLGRNTLPEYVSYMETAYLLFRVSNFTDSLSTRMSVSKYYFYDNGLLNNFISDNNAKLLENIVAIDLIKRYRTTEGDGVYYYNKNIEVDFYVPTEGLAVQVSYSLSDISTREREINALEKLSSVFPLKKAVIVTSQQEETLQNGGLIIEVVPVWKWLLRA